MQTTEFKLQGLTCGACAKLATMSLKKIGGVVEVDVDNGGSVKMVGERVVTKAEIESVLIGTNYRIA